MRGWPQRLWLLGLSLIALVVLLAACPQPKPPIDAGPLSCEDACLRAVGMCPTLSPPVCKDLCNRIGSTCAGNLGAATDCPSVTAACR